MILHAHYALRRETPRWATVIGFSTLALAVVANAVYVGRCVGRLETQVESALADNARLWQLVLPLVGGEQMRRPQARRLDDPITAGGPAVHRAEVRP